MYKEDIVEHFGGMSKLVQAFKKAGYPVTRQGIYQWPEVIPLNRAFQVEKMTRGKMKTDLEVYRMYYRVKDRVA